MEAYLQQEKIMNMLRQPIPGKRVEDVYKRQVMISSAWISRCGRWTGWKLSLIHIYMGLRMSKVVLRQSHGVFLKKQAQITAKDCVGKTNIIDFCGCISADNPLTKQKARCV